MGDTTIVLESRSWEKGGEEAREKHLNAVMENAGREVVKEDGAVPEPKLELKNLTPEALEKNIRTYGAQIEEETKVYADWEELKSKFEANDVEIGVPVQVAIIGLKNGAKVTRHLMEHPDEAKALGRMCRTGRANDAVEKVGRLSSRLMREASRAPQHRRPAENASFEEIMAHNRGENYYGKANDIRRALSRR